MCDNFKDKCLYCQKSKDELWEVTDELYEDTEYRWYTCSNCEEIVCWDCNEWSNEITRRRSYSRKRSRCSWNSLFCTQCIAPIPPICLPFDKVALDQWPQHDFDYVI